MGSPCRNHLCQPLLWTKDYTTGLDNVVVTQGPTIKYSSSPEVASYKSRGEPE